MSLPDDVAPAQPVTNQSVQQPADAAMGCGLVCVGLLAGVLGHFVVSHWGAPFLIPKELADLPTTAPAEKLELKDQATRQIVCLNSTVSIAWLAGIIGATLCGYAARGRSNVVSGILVGAIAGGLLGAFGGAAGQLLLDRLRPIPEETLPFTVKTILSHLAVWTFGGVGVGFGVGFAVRKSMGLAGPLFAGLLGGAVAGLIYSPLGAIAFPLNETDRIVPTGTGNSLFWTMMTGGVISIVIARLARSRQVA